MINQEALKFICDWIINNKELVEDVTHKEITSEIYENTSKLAIILSDMPYIANMYKDSEYDMFGVEKSIIIELDNKFIRVSIESYPNYVLKCLEFVEQILVECISIYKYEGISETN